MSTASLLRICNGSRCILMKSQLLNPKLMPHVQNKIISKNISLSPAMNKFVIEYLRARRGPFTPEEKRGDHKMMASTHWKIERALAISMLGVMPACLFVQGPMMDFLLSSTVMVHGFWGVDGVLTDYLEKFVPWIHYIWYALTISGLAGLIYFNYNDVGVCKAIEMVWRL